MLERDEQLQVADSALRAAERGAGSVIVVEGAAGIGKTSLLAAVERRAEHRGLTCLSAAAGERERDLQWSVARSLVAGALPKLSDSARGELDRGPARLVLGLVGEPVAAGAPADRGALLYALYWLVVALAAQAPVLLCVDDAHWADEASLRWLEYLGARIRQIGMVLAVSRRTDAAPIQLQALTAHEWSRVLRPAPLSAPACARVLAGALGREPEPVFADACCELTAGNPFLLGALTSWLRARDVQPVRTEVPRLGDARPGEVKTWAMLRLQGLAAPALEGSRWEMAPV
jgi:hypothetical protein